MQAFSIPDIFGLVELDIFDAFEWFLGAAKEQYFLAVAVVWVLAVYVLIRVLAHFSSFFKNLRGSRDTRAMVLPAALLMFIAIAVAVSVVGYVRKTRLPVPSLPKTQLVLDKLGTGRLVLRT